MVIISRVNLATITRNNPPAAPEREEGASRRTTGFLRLAQDKWSNEGQRVSKGHQSLFISLATVNSDDVT